MKKILFLYLVLFVFPLNAADYTVGRTINPSVSKGGNVSKSIIDRSCIDRCLSAGGNQYTCDRVCDKAVYDNLYGEDGILKAIEPLNLEDDFVDVNFSCFKKCREEEEDFDVCKKLCKP